MAHTVVSFLLAAGLAGAAAAYQPVLDERAIAEATALGQSRDNNLRIRFHQPYRLPVNRPPVDYIEVITPFRRVELAAEGRAQRGDRLFRQKEAIAALASLGEAIELIVEMTFHPLNTYLGVPAYAVTLRTTGSPAPAIIPRSIERIPRHSARIEGALPPDPTQSPPALPQGSGPMLGGTLIVRFDNRMLNPMGVYEVVISEAGKDVARARLNLAAMR